MPRTYKKTFQKTFSITQEDLDNLTYIVENSNRLSLSHALRDCINIGFEKLFPDYIRIQYDKRKEKKAWENLSPLEYAKQLGAWKINNGVEAIFLHCNGVKWPVSLSEIKNHKINPIQKEIEDYTGKHGNPAIPENQWAYEVEYLEFIGVPKTHNSSNKNYRLSTDNPQSQNKEQENLNKFHEMIKK